jgi:hypothetical protein
MERGDPDALAGDLLRRAILAGRKARRIGRKGQPAELQGIRSEAAEGIRTLDLLHGKQTL